MECPPSIVLAADPTECVSQCAGVSCSVEVDDLTNDDDPDDSFWKIGKSRKVHIRIAFPRWTSESSINAGSVNEDHGRRIKGCYREELEKTTETDN